MTRDNQKARVYRAEMLVGKQFPTIHDVRAYVDRLVRSKWWRDRFDVEHVIVGDGRGRRSASGRGWGGGGEIRLPRWARHEATVLHELAHVTLPHRHKHGPHWVGTYLVLIDRQMGREAMLEQMAEFRRHNVEWRMPGWWKR